MARKLVGGAVFIIAAVSVTLWLTRDVEVSSSKDFYTTSIKIAPDSDRPVVKTTSVDVVAHSKRTPRPSLGYLQHKNKMYDLRDLMNPAFRASCDDDFARKFDPNTAFADIDVSLLLSTTE